MSKEQESVDALVRIVSIRDVSFSMADVYPLLSADPNMFEMIGVELGGKHLVDPEKQFVMFRITAEYHYEKGEFLYNLLKYECEFTYRIANFAEILPFENGHYRLKENLMIFLVGTVISSMRGILVEKTANTLLRSVYLPIVSTREITEQLFGEFKQVPVKG